MRVFFPFHYVLEILEESLETINLISDSRMREPG